MSVNPSANENGVGTTLVDLRNRVQAIETNIKIAIAVAAIFGLSGAWVFTQVKSLHNQVIEVQDKVAKAARDLEKSKERAIEAVHRSAPDAVNEASSNLRSSLFQDLKIQSGKGRLGGDFIPDWPLNSGNGDRTYSYRLEFPETFASPPTVRVAAAGVFADPVEAYGVEVGTVTRTDFELLIRAYQGSHIRSVQYVWLAHR